MGALECTMYFWNEITRSKKMEVQRHDKTFAEAMVGVAKGEHWSIGHWKQGTYMYLAGESLHLQRASGGHEIFLPPNSSIISKEWGKCGTALELAEAEIAELQRNFEQSVRNTHSRDQALGELNIRLERQSRIITAFQGATGCSGVEDLAECHTALEYRVMEGKYKMWRTRAENAERRLVEDYAKVACPPPLHIDGATAVVYWKNRAELAEAHIGNTE